MTITQSSWAMLYAIRAELGFDKPIDPEPQPEPVPVKRGAQPHGLYREQKRTRPPKPQPHAGEIPIQDYVEKLMADRNITRSAAWRRIHDRCEPLIIRRINKCIQFVRVLK